MPLMNDQELVEALTQWMASGKLPGEVVLPALAELRREASPRRTSELLEALRGRSGKAFRDATSLLMALRREAAASCHRAKKAGDAVEPFRELLDDLPLDLPLGRATAAQELLARREAQSLKRDELFLDSRKEELPLATETVKGRLDQASARAAELHDPLPAIEALGKRDDTSSLRSVLGQWKELALETRRRALERAESYLAGRSDEFPRDLPESAARDLLERAYRSAKTPQEKERALDAAFLYPRSGLAPLIVEMGDDPDLRERAVLLSTLRVGEGLDSWKRAAEDDREVHEKNPSAFSERPAETLLLWAREREGVTEEARRALRTWCLENGEIVSPQEFVERRSSWLDPREKALLVPPETPVLPQAPPRPEAPPPPSLWDEHVLPFFSANWTLLAGIAMVVVGSSLLAFYTWDKHWLVRYTILPALLGGFTATLATVGRWLESRTETLRTTAAMLRGAAIALLPANFMAVALLARDPQVAHKEWVVPLVALLYLVVFGFGLERWCGAVDPRLRRRLSLPLLLLNALVLWGPLVEVYDASGRFVWPLLAAGFYAGFLALAWAVVRFVRENVSRKRGPYDPRVLWFFGATLASTYLQVFLWVHGFLRHVPAVETYACLVIAAGGLVLYAEHVAHRLRSVAPLYGKESFLGYALVLLGLFMGASDPQVRTLSMGLAGLVWLAQAVARRDELHAWIALTLLALGAGSFGLWSAFPGRWIPALGLVVAIGMEVFGHVARRFWDRLGGIACQMQATVLLVTTALAPLVQWHYRSTPAATGICLLATAVLFAWRARSDQKLAYVLSATTVLALALPYLGFADMSGRSRSGNNVTFGLGLLSFGWLALLGAQRSPLLLAARSTVLFIYGAFALGALVLRVYFETGRPEDIAAAHVLLSLAGPVLMAAALVVTAYYSRSLLPILLGALMGIVLLPEMKMELERFLPFLTWGSGLGSSVAALLLTLTAFPVRSSKRLENLGQGDLLAGRAAFPLQRHDATLFTHPLLASAVFLALKVDSWNVLRNLAGGGVHLKTSVALVLVGVTWTLLGVYARAESGPKTLVHLGWVSMLAGLTFGYYDRAASPHWYGAVLLCGLALQAQYLLYRYGLAPRFPWVRELLAAPVRAVLRVGSVLVGAVALGALLFGSDVNDLLPLVSFTVLALGWFGLTDESRRFGALAFLLGWAALLAGTSPGDGPLLARLTTSTAATPTLLYFLSIPVLYLLLEGAPPLHHRLRALIDPMWFLATLGASAAAILGIVDAVFGPALSFPQQGLLFALVLLTARGQKSGQFALLAMALGYVDLFFRDLGALPGGLSRLEFLVWPWRLGSFALALAVASALGERIARRWPRLLAGPYALRFFTLPAAPWLVWPAVALSAFSVLEQTTSGAFRNAGAQLFTPYLAVLTFAVVGGSLRSTWPLAASVLFLIVGNVHVVRFFLGERLRDWGLLENHLVCLGATGTLLQLSLVRRVPVSVRLRERAVVFLNRATLTVAGLVLALLVTTYFVRPDLEAMSNARFVLSGLMAYLAGRSFQRAARRPDEGERRYVPVWEGLYHFGVTTSIWCAALLIPWFRDPYAAFPALALPALYFYLRAELAPFWKPHEVARYRNTAAALSFFLLVIYAFRGAFQMVLFPGAPLGLEHYHFNAPFVMLLALVMLRLHGLGGTFWLAFYGGVAMMTGSYFTLTDLPGLSPFEDPIPSAWCAVGLGHFWLLFSSRPSPLRTLLQRLAAIGESLWESVSSMWGLFLLGATELGLLWGLVHYASDTYAVAPLLLGGATLLVHQGITRRSAPLFLFAALEGMLALHADFFVSSYLTKNHVVWALLALWAASLLAAEKFREGAFADRIGGVSSTLAVFVLAHVLYHGPDSEVGLWSFALGAVLAAITPRLSRELRSPGDAIAAAGLLAAPTWLVFFAAARAETSLRVLLTTASLLATSLFARWVQARNRSLLRARPRLFDQTLFLLERHGFGLHRALMISVLVSTAAVAIFHYDRPFDVPSFVLVLGLYAASAWSWYEEGRRRRLMVPYFLLQLSVVGFFAAIRRQLMLTLGWWNYEYDVWASLLVSFSLAGAKQVLPLRPREMRVPLLGTLLTLPAAVMIWVLVHGLGTDTVLLVVGLYSVLFAYMGRDDQESPYHVVSIFGFVAFVLIVFWSKLELRALQAYVIPVGLGILTLVQMFQEKIPPLLRNQIRGLTLLAMLASSAYYALVDERFPLAFHMTLLVVALAAMAAGSFFRVRLYAFLGFAGLVTDLASILYKVLVQMDRSARMTVIGAQVLVLGALLIGGAVVYKTNQEKFDEILDQWRGRLRSWE